MNAFKLVKSTSACMFVVATMISATGCAMNGPSGGAPPEIPPPSTFVMEFDDFAGDAVAKVIPDGRDPVRSQIITNGNWGWGALHVGVWNAIVTVGMAIPVVTFLESFNHEPAQQPDGAWVWSYEVTVSGVVHSAELHALTVDGNIQWNMYVSKEGFFEDFNWFSGVSNLPGTEGTWTLNNHADDPTPLVGIEWHRSPTTETGDIRYTNIIPDGPENGGYIYFGVIEDTLDAFYEIYNKGADNTIEIEWNRSTKVGRIRDNAHFADDQWHCWDGTLQDTECQ